MRAKILTDNSENTGRTTRVYPGQGEMDKEEDTGTETPVNLSSAPLENGEYEEIASPNIIDRARDKEPTPMSLGIHEDNLEEKETKATTDPMDERYYDKKEDYATIQFTEESMIKTPPTEPNETAERHPIKDATDIKEEVQDNGIRETRVEQPSTIGELKQRPGMARL